MDCQEKTLEETVSNIIENLKEMKNTSTLLDPKGDMNFLIDHINECRVNFSKIHTTSNIDQFLLIISNIYMQLGYTKAILNSKLSLIDPLAKKTLKKMYCKEAKTIFKNMGQCYVLQNKLYSNTEATLHPYYFKIQNKIKELDDKNEKLQKYVAVRPVQVLYETIITVGISNVYFFPII